MDPKVRNVALLSAVVGAALASLVFALLGPGPSSAPKGAVFEALPSEKSQDPEPEEEPSRPLRNERRLERHRPALAQDSQPKPETEPEAKPDRELLEKSKKVPSKKVSSECRALPDQEPGLVSFESSPAAIITIDGVRIGPTPINNYRLAAGCHQVLAVGLTSTKSKRVRIEVEPKESSVVRLTLDSDLQQHQIVGSADEPCRVRRGQESGRVEITTIPYTRVYWDKKELGETPVRMVLPAGCIEIRAVDPLSGEERRFRIEIEPNRTSKYRFQL